MLDIEKNQMTSAIVIMFNNGVMKKLDVTRTIKKMFPQAFLSEILETYKEAIAREWIVVDNHGLYEVKNGKDVKVATFYSDEAAKEYVGFLVEKYS